MWCHWSWRHGGEADFGAYGENVCTPTSRSATRTNTGHFEKLLLTDDFVPNTHAHTPARTHTRALYQRTATATATSTVHEKQVNRVNIFVDHFIVIFRSAVRHLLSSDQRARKNNLPFVRVSDVSRTRGHVVYRGNSDRNRTACIRLVVSVSRDPSDKMYSVLVPRGKRP